MKAIFSHISFSLLAITLFASGCFEMDQTIYLNLDGSGRTEMAITMPIAAFGSLTPASSDQEEFTVPLSQQQLQGLVDDRPGLDLKYGSFTEAGANKIIRMGIGFDSVTDLDERTRYFEWVVDRNEQVLRYIFKPFANANSQRSPQLQEALFTKLSKTGVRVTVQMPRRISWTNADGYSGNTARWFIPAGWFLSRSSTSKVLEARYELTTVERIAAWWRGMFD